MARKKARRSAATKREEKFLARQAATSRKLFAGPAAKRRDVRALAQAVGHPAPGLPLAELDSATLDGFVDDFLAAQKESRARLQKALKTATTAPERAAALTAERKRIQNWSQQLVYEFRTRVTAARAEAAGGGIKLVWRTQEDGQVRPEHAVLNGVVFSPKRPPGGILPGQEWGCRCYSEVLEA